MRFIGSVAPARQFVRVGAFLILAGALSACDRVPGVDGPRVLELLNDTIQLADSVRLVEVTVERSAAGDFEPASIEARSGDVIRFTAADRGGHAISFDGARLDAGARQFLERTGQLRSPPLITTDAAWIITLDDAPPGQYPFRCTTHGAQGVLLVSER